MNLPVIHELFEDIVSEVSDAMGYTVHFRHGHMLEVVNQVKEMMIDPDVSKRYPLIALKHDIKQTVSGQDAECDVKLFIVTLSDPQYTATQRYDQIFKPYLRPILHELISQIARSGYFEQSSYDQVMETVTFTERLFWGNEGVMGNDGNIFADWVDCIEVDFAGLIAFNTCEVGAKTPFIEFAMVGAMAAYIYVKISQDMEDPDGLHEDINIIVNVGEHVPIGISRNEDDHSLFLIDLTDITIEHGDTVTLTMPGDTYSSEAGQYMPVHSSYPVINNV